MIDKALATDRVLVARYPGALVDERHNWKGIWTLEKFDAPIEWYAARWAKSHASARQVALIESGANYNALARYVKVAADRAMRRDIRAYAVESFANGALNAGINAVWTILIGNASAANTGASPATVDAVYNNAQARIGVGDSATAFAATQTDLQAATNKFYQVMDASFPSVAAQTVSYRITVAGTNANYAWNEFVVDNCGGSNSTSTTRSGGTTLNRAVSAQGTKTSGQTWVPTVAITLA